MTATLNRPTDTANIASATKRREMAEHRKALREGAELWPLLDERVGCFSHWALLDLLKLQKGWNTWRVARLNKWAVYCGINLAVSLGDADDMTLEWVRRALDTNRPDETFKREGLDIRDAARKATRTRTTAVRVATTMGAAIESHRREIQDPVLNADVAKADADLWKTAELASRLETQ